MTRFATYLAANGLRPALQLCSDDFEGPTAGNANLAAKAIVGLGAYALLCQALGRADDHIHYLALAQRYAREWVVLSAGGRQGAVVRAYNVSGSWSLKYNLVWDQVFGLHLFDDAITRECAFVMADDRYSDSFILAVPHPNFTLTLT